MLSSNLTNIKGLGKKRIKFIWNNYDSFSELLNDTNKNINSKTSIPIKVIKSITTVLKSQLGETNE